MAETPRLDEMLEQVGSLRFAIRALEKRAWLTIEQEAELKEMRRKLRFYRKEIDKRIKQNRLF